MADLYLKNIYKVYPNGVKAVSNFNMKIKDKEFIVFVGPSGCGKSTTLRMIAGLEDITAGELYIGEELVNNVEPKDRDIAMVFQNYALYPHMTVYDNMAFGLKLRHVPRAEIHKKVLWAADVLKITEFLDRKPRAMSGGQRQRVALGRAILRNPKVFLLDEPLSNLDAKLRTEMRAEIAKIHSQLQTTFIYVTHDQTEAMTLGTRVVVMKLGEIQQIDSPQNLYNFPANKFVAGFIGTPQMNFFEATLKRQGDIVELTFDYCDNKLYVPFEDLLKVKPAYLNGKQHVWVGLRCEDISLEPSDLANSKNKMKIKVSHFEELGSETLIYGDLNMGGDGFVESSTRVIAKSNHGYMNLKPGDIVEAAFNMKKAHFFDKTTEDTIVPRIPKENVFDCTVKDNMINFLGISVKLPTAIKCKDLADGKFLVPTDAIEINENGEFTAKVVNNEVIGETTVCYLKIGGRTFFAIVNDAYPVGKDVRFDIDYKSIAIKEGDDEIDIVKPLSVYDTYLGLFTNLENNTRAVKSLCKLSDSICEEKVKELEKEKSVELAKHGVNDYLYKEYKNEYKETIDNNKTDLTFKLTTMDLGKDGRKKVRAEFKAANEAAKKLYEERIHELDSKKAAISDADRKAVEEIKADYANREKEVKDLYASINNDISSNASSLNAIAGQGAEELNQAYQAKLAELKEARKSEIDALYAELKNTTDKDEKASIRAKITRINDRFDKEEETEGLKCKKFYIGINGHYVESSFDITRRIVQAFGTKLFKSNYRYEISHYDYKRVSEGGLKANVTEILDYGKEKFAKCLINKNVIYVAVKDDVKAGDLLHLTFDLNNIRVYENKFDIRLY